MKFPSGNGMLATEIKDTVEGESRRGRKRLELIDDVKRGRYEKKIRRPGTQTVGDSMVNRSYNRQNIT